MHAPTEQRCNFGRGAADSLMHEEAEVFTEPTEEEVSQVHKQNGLFDPYTALTTKMIKTGSMRDLRLPSSFSSKD